LLDQVDWEIRIAFLRDYVLLDDGRSGGVGVSRIGTGHVIANCMQLNCQLEGLWRKKLQLDEINEYFSITIRYMYHIHIHAYTLYLMLSSYTQANVTGFTQTTYNIHIHLLRGIF